MRTSWESGFATIYIFSQTKDLSINELTLLEFRDLVFVEMFGDKSLVNNCASDVYDDWGSRDNVQYRLYQQEFRLEKLKRSKIL